MDKTLSTEAIKAPNSKTPYAPEQELALARCLDDPLYFMREFVLVQHPIRGALPFEPYEFQERIINGIHEHRFSIILTARQQGKTTCAAAYLLWKAIFTENTTILVTANKYLQALEIMDRIRYAYENLPDFLRAGAKEYNKGTIMFDNGSRIVSRATSSDAGRGLSISLLYCLAGDSEVTVRNKKTGMVERISLRDLYERLEPKEQDLHLCSRN